MQFVEWFQMGAVHWPRTLGGDYEVVNPTQEYIYAWLGYCSLMRVNNDVIAVHAFHFISQPIIAHSLIVKCSANFNVFFTLYSAFEFQWSERHRWKSERRLALFTPLFGLIVYFHCFLPGMHSTWTGFFYLPLSMVRDQAYHSRGNRCCLNYFVFCFLNFRRWPKLTQIWIVAHDD